MGTMANILSISPKENQPVLPTFMCSFFLFLFNEKADFQISTLCFPPVLGFRLFQVTSKFSKFNWLFRRKFSLKDDDNNYSCALINYRQNYVQTDSKIRHSIANLEYLIITCSLMSIRLSIGLLRDHWFAQSSNRTISNKVFRICPGKENEISNPNRNDKSPQFSKKIIHLLSHINNLINYKLHTRKNLGLRNKVTLGSCRQVQQWPNEWICIQPPATISTEQQKCIRMG